MKTKGTKVSEYLRNMIDGKQEIMLSAHELQSITASLHRHHTMRTPDGTVYHVGGCLPVAWMQLACKYFNKPVDFFFQGFAPDVTDIDGISYIGNMERMAMYKSEKIKIAALEELIKKSAFYKFLMSCDDSFSLYDSAEKKWIDHKILRTKSSIYLDSEHKKTKITSSNWAAIEREIEAQFTFECQQVGNPFHTDFRLYNEYKKHQ